MGNRRHVSPHLVALPVAEFSVAFLLHIALSSRGRLPPSVRNCVLGRHSPRELETAPSRYGLCLTTCAATAYVADELTDDKGPGGFRGSPNYRPERASVLTLQI